MKDLKRFIKQNKRTTIVFILCVIFVILVFVVKLVFFPAEATAIYGDRLDGIEEVEITSDQEKEITDGLKDNESVKDASTDIRGRLLNVIITVNDDVTLDTAKGLTSIVTEPLEADQISYYDIQVFINKDNDDASFPIIGYKHQNKDGFTFTKDR